MPYQRERFRLGEGRLGGEGPELGGVARAGAEVDDETGEALAGAVEGTARETGLSGGADDGGRLDGRACGGKKVEEPTGAEVDLGRRGRRVAAEVGLDDLEAAQGGGRGHRLDARWA
jgi:hypothetical protein